MSRRTGVIVASFVAVVVASLIYVCYFSVEWTASSTKAQLLWGDESMAAYGPRSGDTRTSIGALSKGEVVDVLRDRYGKDYWACLVRTRSGEKGWVLCTNLDATARGT